MDIQIADLLGRELRGHTMGTKHFARMCATLDGVGAGEVVVLDFEGVDLVTGSWLAAMLAPLVRWAADERHDLFFVLVNSRDGDLIDELRVVARLTNQCFLLADGARPPRRAALIGALDASQWTTLRAVAEAGEVTGAELERRMREEAIGATAWNNRLRDLHEKRLLRRRKRGREQLYSAVVEEITVDG